MIKTVVGTGSVVSSTIGNGSYVPDSGVVRFNAQSRSLEVLQSSGNWLPLNTDSVNINLSSAAEAAIAWALNQMSREAELAELCAQHPGLKDAKEKFDIMKALVSHQ